jgi:hypothetical protein
MQNRARELAEQVRIFSQRVLRSEEFADQYQLPQVIGVVIGQQQRFA